MVYARLQRSFTNAWQAGSGLGLTFPAAWPAVRIDHVWLRGLTATHASVPRSRASDHRPLLVQLTVPAAP